MRITTDEQNLLVIKDRKIFAFVIGFIFTLAGLLIILKPNLFSNRPPTWSGIAGILIGVFLLCITKNTTINLNKMAGKLLLERKGLLGRTTKEYDLNQIKEIDLTATYNSSSSLNRGGNYSYKLTFVLNDGEKIPLNSNSLSSSVRVIGIQLIPERKVGAKIAEFLKIPFQETRPPTVGETISDIQSAIQNAAKKEAEKQDLKENSINDNQSAL